MTEIKKLSEEVVYREEQKVVTLQYGNKKVKVSFYNKQDSQFGDYEDETEIINKIEFTDKELDEIQEYIENDLKAEL